MTVGLSFLVPDAIVSYSFLAGSVFLAFAYLNPDFEILILMVIPVKVRWLSLLVWAYYLYYLCLWRLGDPHPRSDRPWRRSFSSSDTTSG